MLFYQICYFHFYGFQNLNIRTKCEINVTLSYESPYHMTHMTPYHMSHILPEWRFDSGFEITKNILSCDRARFRAWSKMKSCEDRAI